MLSFLRGIVKAAIDLLGRLRGANGTAINACGGHGHEKEAVETRIMGDERFVK
jgi:hypothetical protein